MLNDIRDGSYGLFTREEAEKVVFEIEPADRVMMGYQTRIMRYLIDGLQHKWSKEVENLMDYYFGKSSNDN